MTSSPELKPLALAHRRTVGPAARMAAVGWVAAACFGALHIGRSGTLVGRLGAGGLVVVALVVASVWMVAARRRVSSPERLLQSLVLPVQPEAGGRLLRAYRLSRSAEPGQSLELVQAHYARSLRLLDYEAVEVRLAEHARLYRRFALVCAAAVIAVFAFAPRRTLEGLDVLVASAGRAPFAMPWLDGLDVTAQAPSYLGQGAVRLMMQTALSLPEGTVVTFRGMPVTRGRDLVVTDGATEVKFAPDGSGQVVARWELTGPAVLEIAARFGEVKIVEPRRLELYAVPDLPPSVDLVGAPKSFELETLERLELNWSARDDHSLVQVELVLRSAGREERRPLERYPGDKRSGAGGHVLYNSDPFFRRLFFPATVTIEARDNDPRRGNKWGRSQSFTVHPPGVGAPALARYRALEQVRDAWTRILAARVDLAKQPAANAAARQRFAEAVARTKTETFSALAATYGGLEVPPGWTAFARAQLESLDRAYRRGRDEVLATEALVLGLDRGLQTLVEGDARSVSKQLGDVAEEAALAARLQQSPEQRELGGARLELALSVLNQGIRELFQLGMLGEDIGSVARGDIGRVFAAQAQLDLFHAELALLHMAARLHRPNPSFGSKGGGGGGVEAGPGMAGGSGGDAQGESSAAKSEFDKLMGELQKLAQEHSESLGRTGGALSNAEKKVSIDGLQEEAARRAESLRRAVLRLPPPGAAPGTSQASAALTREHAGAMAHELGRLGFPEALESGRRAVGAAEAAIRSGALAPGLKSELEQVQVELREHMAWAQEMAEQMRRLTQQAAQDELQSVAQLEAELAERARRMSQPNESGGTLPLEAQERLRQAQMHMAEAAARLRAGEGESGLSLQRQAQRLLEEGDLGESNSGDGETPSPSDSQQPGEGLKPAQGGTVPGAEKTNPAEDFRRRVLDGLGKAGAGRLAPAVRRYAEGLLR